MTPVVIGATLGGIGALLLILPLIALMILRVVAPATYARVTWRCQKHPMQLTGDGARGPVGDQLRAILSEMADRQDVFKTWDKDGGGTVSRKEFRLWWPKIGYEAPVEDLNALFDEFDVDGSGEIDEDEFKNAYEQRGHLWRKLEELKRQHDEGDAVQRQIDELRAKVSRKTTARQVELDAMAKQREGIAERASHADRIREEMKGLTENLDAREARLRAFKGGIKEMMVLNSIVRAFQMTPDDAATKVQAAVRGKNARKEVAEKSAEPAIAIIPL